MSKSAEGLAKMMTVVVTVIEATGLTVSAKKAETMLVRTPGQAPQTSPLVIKAVGPRGIDRQRRFGVWAVLSTQVPTVCQRSNDGKWACYNSRFKRELYGKEAASFALKVRMLKVEVIETLLYGCVT